MLHIYLNNALDNLGWERRGRASKLRKLLKKANIPVSETATKKWLDGESNPTTDKILPIAEAIGTTPEYLLYGKEVNGSPMIYHKYPLLSENEISDWIEEKPLKHLENRHFLISENNIGDKCFCFKHSGDAMIAASRFSVSITDNSRILVNPNLEHKHGSIVLAYFNGSYKVRRLAIDGDSLIADPLNSEYTREAIKSDSDIVGVCIEFSTNIP